MNSLSFASFYDECLIKIKCLVSYVMKTEELNDQLFQLRRDIVWMDEENGDVKEFTFPLCFG